uniref:Protocadherin-16 n=1 Tax=Scleropages formosus TaxID=113540 RepID=A0A8C9VBP1_SCLFO
MSKGRRKTIMLLEQGGWRRRMLLLLCVALELMTAHSSMVLGTLELQLDEEQPAGTIVGDISAGLPPGVTASLYFISDHEGTGVGSDLHIDETTGIITTAKVLDREARDRYSFIAVTMTGITVEVTITVNDINDHAPTFPKQRATFKIPEQTAIGTKFPLEPATDADKDQLTTQGYLIKDGNVGQAFLLQSKRGSNNVLSLDLVVNAILDREKRSSYTLLLEAFDGGSPKRIGQMILDVIVQDVNDNAPIFNQSRYHTIISENTQPGSNILQVFASDADEGDNGLVLYEINRRQSDADRYFSIDPHTGIITLSKPLDYEMRRVHELVVQARDNASHPEVSNAFVTVHVRDYNDNQPTMTIIFLSEDGSPQISEGAQPGQFVARISVTDPDYGEYSNVNVSLEGGDGKFALTTKDNIIYLICVDKILDREERDSYELRVMATDSGTPPLRAESSFTIQVTDINDNPPLFDQPVYTQAIPEVVFPGSFVLQVTARDKDQGPNGDVQYSILQGYGTHSDWFTIDSTTGIITTATQLDYETDPKPSLIVVARDAGRPPLSSTAVVNIKLQDINDNEPVFAKSFYEVSIKENTPAGTCFLTVTATDADSGSFGSISYSIGTGIGSTVPTQFAVGKETGQICATVALDRDKGPPTYDFTIAAVDGGGLNSMAYVKVSLVDVNDNRPTFYPVQYAVSLSTQSAPGTSVVRVTAHDPDAGDNGRVTYRTVPGWGSSYFTLNKDTGVISLSRSLHGKANTVIPMVIAAQDGGGLTAPVNAQVNISVVAGLVAPPVFEQTLYLFTVSEDALRGTQVGVVRASSRAGASKDVFYTICSGDPDGYFTVDPETGVLRTSRPLDHEAWPSLELEVQARSGSPPAFGQTRVRITVADVNDNAPTFLPSSSESLLLPEATALGAVVYRVRAEDPDSGPNGRLSFDLALVSGTQRTFSVDRTSGEIRLVGVLSYEMAPRHDLLITARDSGAPQLSATFTLVVHVQAEDDQGPTFDTLTYRVELREGTPVNTCFLQVRALHREAGGTGGNAASGPLAYHLRPDGDAAGFGIAADSGWLFVKTALDREAKDLYLLTVLATSGSGQLKKTGSATVRVSVTDENDNAPRLAQELAFLAVRENLPAGTGFGRVLASDRDAGQNSRLTYRFLHADRNFQISSQTGEITTRTALDREHQSSYQLMVVVQDGGTPPRSATGTIHITVLDDNDNAPSFSHAQAGRELVMQVTEEQPPGSLLGIVQAKDPDEGENGTVFFSLSGPRAERFSLNPNTGELRTSSPLSHAERAEYVFTVTATDRGLPPRSSSSSLLIQVGKVWGRRHMGEACVVDRCRVSTTRPCDFTFFVVMLLSENFRNVPCLVDLPFLGSLSILKPIDCEEQALYNLTIIAEDHGTPQHSTVQLLSVHVIDVNDEVPFFTENEYEAQVLENQQPGSSVLMVSASDKDQGGTPWTNGFVTYGGLLEEVLSPFLAVYAKDGGMPPNFAKATVRITVLDQNDNRPAFTAPLYHLEVPENLEPVGTSCLSFYSSLLFPVLLFVKNFHILSSEDLLLFSAFSCLVEVLVCAYLCVHVYSFTPSAGDPDGDFHLDSRSGVLATSRPLDQESRSKYMLTVVAQDHGSPSLSGTATVEVTILDVNDNSPKFEQSSYTVEIPEDASVGSLVLEVTATDEDQGSNSKVLYFLRGAPQGMFQVDQDTGQITTAMLLDRERWDSYSFLVCAADLSPASPRNTTAQVTVIILDVNDNAPFFVQDPLVVNVSSFSLSSHQVVATMRAEDKDFGANGSVFYRFANPVKGFTINSLTGAIQVTESLQTLTQSQHTLIVQAVDQGSPSQSSLGVVIIYIKEQEYKGIRFSRNARDVSIQENAAKGTAVVQVQAQHPDGSRRGITYSLFSGNRQHSFSISPTSGEIFVQSSAALDFEENPRLRLVVKAESASSSSFMAVNLILQDVNDNKPRFQLQNYVAYIQEAQGYDFPIIQVLADDLDQGQNGQVTYSLKSSSMSGLFRIDPLTGSISTSAIMDREIWTQTKLVVTATDRGSPRLAGSATLTVIIVDVNDNSPTIPLPREVRVPENTMIGTEITQVTGNDVDSGPPLSYTLQLDSHSLGKFGIHRYGGGVSLTAPLDFEERTWYTLTIRSSDSRHQSEANLTVLVEDVNDNAPVFTQDLYQVTLPEHSPPGTPVITVTATDRDAGKNGKVTYRVMSSTLHGFSIDPSNGTLFINERIEFDSDHPSISVLIEAKDGGTPALTSITTVLIHLLDVNDHTPAFHQSEYKATVSEDGLPGATILTLEAIDGDLSRENCGFDFAIASGNMGNAFQIESSVRYLEGRGFQTVGTLILVEQLDFEAAHHYNLTIVVSDRGVPQRSSSVLAIVTVTDANDNAPVFNRAEYSVVLSEGAATGTELLRLLATDPDSALNAKVQYTISSGDEMDLFSIDQWTGALRLQRSLDRERKSSHVVIIQASDGNGHYTLAPVTVEVKDINDNRPFFPLKTLTVSIRENLPPNVFVTMLHAIDYDTGIYGQLKYYMVDKYGEGRDSFVVNQTSGEVHTRLTFDYEKVNSFNFVALAMDPGNYSATVTVQIYITGEDEYDPVFASSDFFFEVPEGAKQGQSIGQVHARDEDGGLDGIVLYSFPSSSPYFEINKTTGVVFLKLDSSNRHIVGGRSKREVRQMTLDVTAHSPLETSRVAKAQVTIDVTRTSFGLAPDVNLLLISVIAASLGVIVMLIIIAITLFLLRSRRKRKEQDARNRTGSSGTVMQKLDESRVIAGERIYHQTLPGYTSDQGSTGGVPYPRGGSLDPSHSSGRGSAEAEAAEDDEIRMINEYPRVSSISSSMQEHISARGPDSGIQQDADQLSDISCEPVMETSQWFKGKKLGSLAGTLLSTQHPMYRDEGGGYLSVGRGLNLSHPKDYAFPEDGKPSVDGSLTAIVASDEELRGSYNWDYLLNWCPQFQPLASVFTEIARLKDENAPPNPRRPFQPKSKTDPKPRIDPPPLITSVAHPGAKTVPPKPAIGRTFPHLLSLRRSPISNEGSISSAAMSPSFSPSLSPLAACSPAVSPFGVTQGPSASMISTAEHSLDQAEEAEMRI